jgi:hypothetical protein
MTSDMPVVTVTEELIEQARELQQTRNSGEYVNPTSVNTNPTQDHMIGAIGELIIADWYGDSVDWDAKYGDNGIDITHDTGGEIGEITMDVKTTKYSSGSMVMPQTAADEIENSDNKQKPTIYVLVRRKSGDKYEIAGWEFSDNFLSDENLCPMLNGGPGQNHKLGADDLYNLQTPKSDLEMCQLQQAGDSQFASNREEATTTQKSGVS